MSTTYLSTLKNRRVATLVMASTASAIGNGFGRVALVFGLIGLSGVTTAQVSLIIALQALPQLVFVLWGGVLADRFSRQKLMIGAEVSAGLTWGVLAVAIHSQTQSVALLSIAAVLAGAATAMYLPAMSGVMPQLAPPETLLTANAMLRVGQNVGLLVGLGFSGVVVAWAGPVVALSINAASFFIGAGLLASLRISVKRVQSEGFFNDFRDGMREFVSRPWLCGVVAQFAFVVVGTSAFLGLVGPLLYSESANAQLWSFALVAQSVGSAVGAAVASRIRSRRPIRTAVLCSFPLAGPMLAVGLAAHWVIVCALMFISGVSLDVFGVLWVTTVQQQVPERLLSRIFSYDFFGSLALAPLGLLAAGPLVSAVGAPSVAIGCAALVVVATVCALLIPSVRQLTVSTGATPTGAV